MKLKSILYTTLIASLITGCAQKPKEKEATALVSASTNILGISYPVVNPDLSVTIRVNAPDADSVKLDLMKKYPMTKNADGIWEVTSDPQVPGFHYYFLEIDGCSVADPSSELFYGCGRMSSGKFLKKEWITIYLSTFHTVKSAHRCTTPTSLRHGESALYILRQVMTRTTLRSIPYYICNMVAEKTKPDGRTKERQTTFWIT